MPRLRSILAALTVLILALAPVLLPTSGSGRPSLPRAFAAAMSAPALDNGNRNGNNNGNNNGNSNGNSNGNDDNGNDNVDDAVRPPPSRSSAPAPPAAPACMVPGQEMTFLSSDGRIEVHVFSSLAQSIRLSIRQPIDPASVPPTPGPLVDALRFQVVAESCDGTPIPVLPAEVNLGVHYADADAAGLNEAGFTLARLDTSANQWRPAAQQAADPASNVTSATIAEMGFYALYQRP